MPSFSNDAKTEICGTVRSPAECRSFLTGVLLGARHFTAGEITVQTECTAFAALFPRLLQTVCPKALPDTEYRTRAKSLPLWTFSLTGIHTVRALTDALGIDPENRAAVITQENLREIAAGLFVSCGSVTDPSSGYHLEMLLPDPAVGEALMQALTEMGQPEIAFKSTPRRSGLLLYLKQNEQIGDLLAYLGALDANFELINQQVMRSMRSQTNRRLNCDMANIDKAVAAGNRQAEVILRIQQSVGIASLPDDLQELAQLRLEEPDMSLRDLGALLHPPLSRSGVHHRLQRIAEIASKL